MKAQTIVFACVLASTIVLFFGMLTAPLWGWKGVKTFRLLKEVRSRLESYRIDADGEPLPKFVEHARYGDKVVVYHHLHDHVSDYLSRAPRTAIQAFLIFFLLGMLAGIAFYNFSKEAVTLDGAFQGLAWIIGATDVVGCYLFLQEFVYVEREVQQYLKTPFSDL